MDLAVTIGAAPIEKEWRILAARRHWMLRHSMALSAQPRIGDLEQPIVHRPMRLVAIRAIFDNGRMLVQERAAPFGMAGKTILVDARLLKLRRIRRAVGIVTARASQLSLPYRHMGRPHQLGLALQMTLTAHLRLRSLIEERRPVVDLGELVAVRGFLHQRVTVDASHAAVGMRAHLPVRLHTALMAAQTRFVLGSG